jgi:hypothetical protein
VWDGVGVVMLLRGAKNRCCEADVEGRRMDFRSQRREYIVEPETRINHLARVARGIPLVGATVTNSAN